MAVNVTGSITPAKIPVEVPAAAVLHQQSVLHSQLSGQKQAAVF